MFANGYKSQQNKLDGNKNTAGLLATWTAATGCIFSNFTIGEIAGFDVNAAFIALLGILIISLWRGLAVSRASIYLFTLIFVFACIKSIGTNNTPETTKSLLQILLMSVVLIVSAPWKRRLFVHERFAQIFIAGMTAHALLLIVQFIAMNHFGTFAWQNPFGEFSPVGPQGELFSQIGAYMPDPSATIKRPNGFYSEPSVAAMYSLFALAICLSSQKTAPLWKVSAVVILSLSIICTFSLSGWLSLSFVTLTVTMVSIRRHKVLFVIGLAALIVIIGFLLLQASTTYLFSRLQNFGANDPAIYIRLYGPIQLVADVVSESIIGLPVNDPTELIGRYYLVDWQGRNFTTIDNFYIWILVYFGIPGAALILASIVKVGRLLRKEGLPVIPLVVVMLFAFATGGGYSSAFVLPLVIALGWCAPFQLNEKKSINRT
ncbi:O-antigen ligase family protein [Paragemmobacter aquarius]|uniref:O-antigen ligase family protein n=1 Tax=Paragemmobacter aquarius TaxID=2169400 RepID=UPI00131EF5BE|nr:O-antigen ligase family protein [Gemmobacter aquarius]